MWSNSVLERKTDFILKQLKKTPFGVFCFIWLQAEE